MTTKERVIVIVTRLKSRIDCIIYLTRFKLHSSSTSCVDISCSVVSVIADQRNGIFDPNWTRTRNLIEKDRDVFVVLLITSLKEKKKIFLKYQAGVQILGFGISWTKIWKQTNIWHGKVPEEYVIRFSHRGMLDFVEDCCFDLQLSIAGTSLTMSSTKNGTDLGSLVVPFNPFTRYSLFGIKEQLMRCYRMWMR